jgi:hypothetical protein
MKKLASVLLAGLIVIIIAAVCLQQSNVEKTSSGDGNIVDNVKQTWENTSQTVEDANEVVEEAIVEAKAGAEQAAEDMQTGYEMTVQDINNAVSSETE